MQPSDCPGDEIRRNIDLEKIPDILPCRTVIYQYHEKQTIIRRRNYSPAYFSISSASMTLNPFSFNKAAVIPEPFFNFPLNEPS